jgi:hypothetical protein
MKRIFLFLLTATMITAFPACSKKSGCPTSTNKKTGEHYIKKNKKTKSGLWGKNK